MTRTERQEYTFANSWYGDYSETGKAQPALPVPASQLTEAEQKRRLLGEIDHALHSAEKIHRSLKNAAEYFYTGRESEAVRFLTHCLEGLARFLEVIGQTRPLLPESFENVVSEGRKLVDVEREFISILESLGQSQEKLDFSAMVERVEDELLTNLSAWITALRGICRSLG